MFECQVVAPSIQQDPDIIPKLCVWNNILLFYTNESNFIQFLNPIHMNSESVSIT